MDKKQINLIRGTILNTQLINDGYDFLILGTYFERADFTARIINVKYFILLPSINYVGSSVDNFQWTMMLRSISSYRAFKWAYGEEVISYVKIIDFLILNTTCPRSLIFSIEKNKSSSWTSSNLLRTEISCKIKSNKDL